MITQLNKKRKGVTPVIAIVLLLTVTIGAVGILYTQVGDLLEQDEGLDDIDRVQDTEMEIRTGISDADDPQDGQLYLSIYNSGDRALPFAEDFHMEINGIDYEAYGPIADNDDSLPNLDENALTGDDSDGCLGSDMQLDVGQTTSDLDDEPDKEFPEGACNTGVDFPSAFDDAVDIEFQLQGSSRTWSFECNPSSNDDGFC